MGKPCFSKIAKFFALSLLGTAAAIAAVAVLSSPAAAVPGGGVDVEERAWDTDNLKIGSTYSARSFAIPHYGSQGDPARNGIRNGVTENHSPCQPSVMDGFFQNRAGQPRNDLPVLEKTGDDWDETPGHICDSFVTAQNLAISRAASNGGFWLGGDGKLRKGGFGTWMSVERDATVALPYTTWAGKGSSYRLHTENIGGGISNYYAEAQASTVTDGYIARVDYGSSLAGRTVGEGIPSGGLTLPSTPVRKGFAVTSSSPKIFRTTYLSQHNASVHLPQAQTVGGSHAGSWCPTGSHPRGEDAYQKIGSGTGRTLSSLRSMPQTWLADLFWCRSDVRYPIRYAPQSVAGTTCGTAGAPSCPSGVVIPTGTFRAWGRVNCYYTARSIDSSGNCVYPHPVPQCTNNGSKRDFTAAELGGYTTGAAFTAADDGSTDCASMSATPPQQAGFTADACVTADLEIYENRIVGSDAEPGVAASDRTLAVAAGRTAWDLDVTSPHPLTASPPRDTTSGSGDPDGCADGSESRADHASAPGDAARKQSPAPSYAASDRTDTAAPPNDADDDIDYSGAVKNMAHRYASRVAENTCAAKRAEAGLRLALLEAEEKLYKDWMERYEVWAKGKKDAFGNWRPTGYPSGANPNTSSSLSVHPTFYSFKHAKRSKSRLDYADAMSTMYETRETAAGAAAGRTLTKPTVGASWCGDPAGFVKTYSDSVTALKTAADNATTAGTARTQPSKGPTSADTPNAGRAGVVDASKLSEGAARVPAEWGTSYTYAYTDSKGKRKSGSSGCWEAGTSPTFGAPAVTYTPGAACISKAAVPEVLASGTASSVTYASYTFTLSGGGWTRTITVPAATRTAVCSSWQTSSCYASPSTHPLHSGYVSLWNGSLPSVTDFPSTTGAPGKSVSSPALSLLLGKYSPSHANRANLKHPAAQTRNQAAADLGKLAKTESATITPTAFSNLAVPVSNPATDTEETTQRNAVKTAAETYQNRYTQAYDNAYDQAIEDMGGKTTTITRNGQTETVYVWSDFDWRYETSTLAWSGYQEDPATTYSASTATPRDGTGCDLASVASDGTVSVEATRLDYETPSYGKGSVYGMRTDAQRTCKIRRTRTPELILEYQPSRPSGTDASKAATFWHVDYQPTPAAERFKLYDEAEVFAVKTSLADRAPVLCYQPGEALVAHVAAKGVKAVNKAVFRHASGFAGGNKKHCYRHPSAAQLGTPPKPAFAFFRHSR